jgi:hypothetical protein
LAARLGLVDLAGVFALPGVILVVGIAVSSYLLGHLTFQASSIVDKFYHRAKDGSDAWRAVADDAAHIGDRQPSKAHPMLLLAGAELRDREVTIEIARFRATGLMLRGAVVPAFLGTLAALIEIIVGPNRWPAAASALLLGLATVGFARHGQQLRYWANTKTYQIAYWLELGTEPSETAKD